MPVFNLQSGKLYEVVIHSKYPDGQYVLNTFHYTLLPDELQVGIASDELLDWLTSMWGGVMGTSIAKAVVAQFIRVVEIDLLSTERQRFDERYINIVGGIDQPVLPPAVALTVQRTTAFVGRKNRGRIFLCGLPKTWTAGGVLVIGNVVPAVQVAWEQMAVGRPLDGDGVEAMMPVLPRPKRSAEPPHRPILYAPVELVGWDYDIILRCQRRRENGVGM